MAREMKLTHQTLTELLDYDPATGVFVWKVARSNRVKVGARAGVFHRPSGGRYISLGDEKFMTHRLAWFYVHGVMPANEVRPLDGNYDNCEIENLVQLTRVELAHRRDMVSTNTSGYKGVSRARGDFWQAKITWNYRQINLGGSFESADEAGATVERAYELLKDARSPDDVDAVIEEIRVDVRRRSAWANMRRFFKDHAWASYEEFASCITDIPARRYALAPVDAGLPIGPDNFRWALPADMDIRVADGVVAYNRAKREANRDLHRDRDFRKKYGISFGQYSQMLEAQNGVCAICSKAEVKLEKGNVRLLSVDHNHQTGAVRGLLCSGCNNGIGYLKDRPETLEKAADYLRKHSGPAAGKVEKMIADSPHRDWLNVASPGFELN